MKLNVKPYDVVIIGGGFYGCALSLFLAKKTNKVLLVEKEGNLLLKASYNNQARIHNGYHYPRSYLTAVRSHLNYMKFVKDFKSAVYDNFKQYYAIASNFSKTTSQQFYKFAKQIGSPIKPAPAEINKLFNTSLIEEVFEVEEAVYDAVILRENFYKSLNKYGVSVVCNKEIKRVEKSKNGFVRCLFKDGGAVVGRRVYNCTYSKINKLLFDSNLPLLPFKQEFTEMPLLKVPEELENLSISVFDGPFFGFLPFPDKKCHSLWHVRYAIRASWVEPVRLNLDKKLEGIAKKSMYNFMIKDAGKYIPVLSESKYLDSIYEVKTVLIDKEENDARPILFRKDYGIENFNIIMGGKIDNIYDVLACL